LAEEFALHALRIAHRGVALLVRSTFTESVGRHANLFGPFPPWAVAQFCERIPMVKGRYDPKASTATGYAWIIWRKHNREPTRFIWIPPCRKALERPDDHILKGAKNV
jgi:hypothetical protein